MKKFDLRGVKGVFANFRSGDKASSKGDIEVQETLQPHDFYCGKLMRHGFPYHPTCMAWDPIQKLVAVGTKHGAVRLLGRPGVDITIQHDSNVIVLQITFLINEGAFITACADDSVHLWSYRQKTPEIVHSLKFSRERITCLHLPFQSKWLYLGTERGNVHIVNVETFTVCGYTINWNKAIEMSRKTHPGPVVHLSDNPLDPNKLLIGFETGLVVCWDLRCKMAEFRFHCTESLRDACWNQDGKLFMCSHADGTLSTWNFRQQAKPVSIMAPHAKANKSGKTSPCKPINRLEWKSMKNGEGEPYVIFSGGMSYDASKSPCLTIMHGKSVTVLEMEHQIIDFTVLCNNVWSHEFDDPYAIIVLLSSDLIFVDMTTPGYPCFQCPYALDVHESPVTCLKYYSDCASDLIPAFYSCGTKQKRKGFSEKEFPVTGGQWGAASCSYFEMLITGHADGSIKFWDTSGINLQFLYRMKTNKLFEKVKRRESDEEDVLAIQHIYLDEESRLLAVAAAHHIILFSFSKKETNKDVAVVEVTAISEVFEETDLPEEPPQAAPRGHVNSTNSWHTTNNTSGNTLDPTKEIKSAVRPKHGSKKHCVGYQPDMITVLQWCEGATPPIITCLCVNSSYGLLAVGTTSSIIIVDTVQKVCILNVLPADLCNSNITRLPPGTPISPKFRLASGSSLEQDNNKQTDFTDAKSQDQQSTSSQADSAANEQPPSPEDENSNNLVSQIDGNHADDVITQLSPGSPASCQPSPDSQYPGPRDSNHHTHPKLGKTVSDSQANTNNSLSIESEHGDGAPKASWKRRLSMKVGNMTGLTSIKQKSSTNHTKPHSAVPLSHNSSGFFSDQKSGRSRHDKPDGVFSRSRSSSTNSLEGAGLSDVVQFLMFADGYTKKQEQDTTPGLWIGTNNGNVIPMNVNLPGSERAVQPVVVSHSGSTFQVKGSILEVCFLDYNGLLIPVEAEVWCDGKDTSDKREKRLVSRMSRNSMSVSEQSEKVVDKHIAVITSDAEIRCVSLPSQNSIYKERFQEGMFIVKAEAIIIKDSVCLACLGSGGNLMVYSLPSLRPLLNVNYIRQFDVRVARTLDFGNHGHAIYMCTATEIQKITVSADMCRAQADMQCEPFVAKENPEAPKQSFLKNLFGSGPSVLDRQELFGTSGKASHGVATLVPGAALQAAHANATGLAADMARTRMALDERGEKLGKLEERTEAMRDRAKEFSQNASLLANKYKDQKWYQL